MDVIAEKGLGRVIAKKRCAGEADFDGLWVGFVEVGKKAAMRVVAAVDFVEEIHALKREIVVGGSDNVWIILEFLDVDDGDFRLAGIVVDRAGGFDVAGEGIAGIDGVDHQAATAEFVGCLQQEVDAIHDEVEFRNDSPFLEPCGEMMDVVIGEGGFAAALGVPDDALADAIHQNPLDRLGGENLRIAHDVFLDSLFGPHVSLSLVSMAFQILSLLPKTILEPSKPSKVVVPSAFA